MSTISAVIIAKNAENLIADCVDSVTFCDEVIVVDNNSGDRTREIAKRLGCVVIEVEGDDFSKLRNAGLKIAKGNWIFYVDVDERVSSLLCDNIKYQISNIKSANIAGYKIKRKNFYYGKHEWPKIEKLERLFKKEKLREWYGKLHESPRVDGSINDLDGYLLHYSHQDLSKMLEKTIEWSKTEAQLRFDIHHPKMTWWRYPRVMITAFFDSYIRQQGFKAGTAGLVEALYQSFSIFITYAKLWEMQGERKSK